MPDKLLSIKTAYSLNGEIKIVPHNIQEIRIISEGQKFKVQLTVVSGRSYFISDGTIDIWDTKAEAMQVVEDLIQEIDNLAGDDLSDLISQDIETDKEDTEKIPSVKAVVDYIKTVITEALGDDY